MKDWCLIGYSTGSPYSGDSRIWPYGKVEVSPKKYHVENWQGRTMPGAMDWSKLSCSSPSSLRIESTFNLGISENPTRGFSWSILPLERMFKVCMSMVHRVDLDARECHGDVWFSKSCTALAWAFLIVAFRHRCSSHLVGWFVGEDPVLEEC